MLRLFVVASQIVYVLSKKVQVAYLAWNIYDLQNDFVINMMNHLTDYDPSIEYELVRYTEPEEITSCLNEGSCLVSLDYGVNQNILEPQQRQLSSDQVESIPLKILDDPVLNITLP